MKDKTDISSDRGKMRRGTMGIHEFMRLPPGERKLALCLEMVKAWEVSMRYVPDEHKLACELFLQVREENSVAILDSLVNMKDSGLEKVPKDLKDIIAMSFSDEGINKDIEQYMNQYLGEVAKKKEFFHSKEGLFSHRIERILDGSALKNDNEMLDFLEILKSYGIKQLHPLLAEKIVSVYPRLKDQHGQCDIGVDRLVDHYIKLNVILSKGSSLFNMCIDRIQGEVHQSPSSLSSNGISDKILSYLGRR